MLKSKNMGTGYRYLFLYLMVAFGIWWGAAFFLISFENVLTPWIGKLTLMHPIIIFVTYLPSIAGLMVYFLWGGLDALKRIIFKLIPRKQDWFWFPLLLALFVLFGFSMHFGCLLFGIPVPKITDSFSQLVVKVFWNFIRETGLIGAVFGWMGFVLPFLQGKLKNNIYSGLLTGLMFGLWVLPGYMISSLEVTTSYFLYVAQLIAFFVFMSYIFNATKGSLAFYLFVFWLVATGSHIQLYYFIVPVQIMQIAFFTVASVVIHVVFKRANVEAPLQVFPSFIQTRTKETGDQPLSQLV